MGADQLNSSPHDSKDRARIYCLLPPEIGEHALRLLERHFASDPDVDLILERRRHDRRGGEERREQGSSWVRGIERRRIKNRPGRRVAERRAPLVPVSGRPLPRRIARHAAAAAFVERCPPSREQVEDTDTARLVIRYQAGEREAFTEIYERYSARVYGYLRLTLADAHEAEDATQQVFLQLLEKLEHYERRQQPFRAWLFTIVRNRALYQLRKHRRTELVNPHEIGARAELAAADEDGIEAPSWISDRDLLLFVERLPLPQRQVLILRYGFDLSDTQIAAILERSPSDVRALQSRALRFLHARLSAVGRRYGGVRDARARQYLRQAPVLRGRRFALLH